ncbi:MAG TPA: SMC-Scp complex subunit ScpB, partial [Pseudomonas sp.]|nr:SMC-Scp complex subunit ScpB [Pseudomonas sp.]
MDTHIHFPQTGMIGSYGEQLLDWLNTYTFPCEKQFADKDHADKVAKIFLKELLRNGTTTALVFGSVHPQSVNALFEEAERPEPKVFRKALEVLGKSCAGRAFELKEVATGYRLQSREDFAPWVGRLWEERPQRYSRALLETMALIAYRQPITRCEIVDVRGVAVNSNIIKTLMEREWIRVVGHREVTGRPAMFATTKAFLDHFNLKGLDELPALAELREMEPEPLLDPDDAPVPAHLKALADASMGEEEGAEPKDETRC